MISCLCFLSCPSAIYLFRLLYVSELPVIQSVTACNFVHVLSNFSPTEVVLTIKLAIHFKKRTQETK
jgi:hypothetical protein|uniref:Secreted protein n=1 Tax=Populus trichocarpa TaxID=3694 RepID=A0A3N7FMQ2_POPTR